MRIICPDCDAQYEVPDEVIPDEGRDVQCSNCGTTWMFGHPEAAHAEEGESPADADDDESDTLPVATLPRRELDPKVAGILRAEAERESAARATDLRPEPLEVQPDLGLTEGLQKPRPAAATATTGRGDPRPSGSASDTGQVGNMTVAAAAASGSRRDHLPDIDEINSSLRSTRDGDVAGDGLYAAELDRSSRRRSFRRGILVAVLVFVACLLVYQFAPQIAEAVPDADPWLSSYVTWVDGMRAILDARIRDVLTWLDARAASTE